MSARDKEIALLLRDLEAAEAHLHEMQLGIPIPQAPAPASLPESLWRTYTQHLAEATEFVEARIGPFLLGALTALLITLAVT